MKDGGKPPGPDETLDAPVYEPPRRRVPLVAVLVFTGMTATVLLAVAFYLGGSGAPPQRPFTRSLIDHLNMACEAFRDNYGRDPWPTPKEVTAASVVSGREVYAELRALPGAKINTNKDFLDGLPGRGTKNGVLVDWWGREIQFRVAPKTGKAVIWSCGPNGIDETNDGESPDPAKYPKGYYWFGKGDTGDDIVAR